MTTELVYPKPNSENRQLKRVVTGGKRAQNKQHTRPLQMMGVALREGETTLDWSWGVGHGGKGLIGQKREVRKFWA